MKGLSLRLSPGQSQVVVDLLVLLTCTFLLAPSTVLLLLPWRRLLPTERALTLLGIGLVMAVLTVAAELWRRRGDRAQRAVDAYRLAGVPIVRVMGPLLCGRCGARLTEGDPRHEWHGPVDGPTPGCEVCERTMRVFEMFTHGLFGDPDTQAARDAVRRVFP